MATEFLGRSAWADDDWSRGGAQLTGEKLVGELSIGLGDVSCEQSCVRCRGL